MKNRKIIALLSAVLLSGSAISAVQASQTTVQATYHSTNSAYWYKPHKVYTTKNVYATLVKGSFLKERHPFIKRKLIPKGTPLKVTRGGSDYGYWAILGNIPVSGFGKTYKANGDFWTIRTHAVNWLKVGTLPVSFKNGTMQTPHYKTHIFDVENNDGDLLIDGKFTNFDDKYECSPKYFFKDHFKVFNDSGKKMNFWIPWASEKGNIDWQVNKNTYLKPAHSITYEININDFIKKYGPTKHIIIKAYNHGKYVGQKKYTLN